MRIQERFSTSLEGAGGTYFASYINNTVHLTYEKEKIYTQAKGSDGVGGIYLLSTPIHTAGEQHRIRQFSY